MKKLLAILLTFLLSGFLVQASAADAQPSKIKVGILLPLTGTFAAVAETQRDGALLAVDVINKRGGLNMPWGKVQVEGVVEDDEAKLDVGVRRYRYMVSEGVKGVGGQTWAPLAYAINSVVAKEPMPYFPVCVMSKDAYMKGKLAEYHSSCHDQSNDKPGDPCRNNHGSHDPVHFYYRIFSGNFQIKNFHVPEHQGKYPGNGRQQFYQK